MAKYSKTPAKKKGAKVPAKKTTTKKTAPKKKVVAKKKPVAKKKIAAKKTAPRKKAVVTKKATTRKPAARAVKATVSKKPIPQKEPVITPKEIQKPEEINNDSVVIEKVETTPPPVEENTPVEKVEANLSSQENENTPVVNLDTTGMLGTDKKSLKRAAVRNYDNHHIRLSNRKGGLKPSGKKPLW